MPQPLHAPRVNNNDDVVQVVGLHVKPGDPVKRGDLVAEVETDKSVAEVEAERDGYVLQVLCELEQQVAVGSVIMWVGESPDEPVPELPSTTTPEAPGAAAAGRPTAKARALLRRHGLEAADVPASGERLTVADIEAYLAARSSGAPAAPAVPAAAPAAEPAPQAPGRFRDLATEEHGMLSTVRWHRDHAAATYLEMEYDPAPWEAYAAAYAAERKLMLSPLLPLLAYRLVEAVRNDPKVNATMVGHRLYEYDHINLGFTVQAGETLYLTVVRDAGAMDAAGFIDALGEVQRRALTRKLRNEDTSGATVAFSSMARWNVSRHVPILPPHTSLMIAHAAPRDSGKAVLGASYDHRVLSGYAVTRVLQTLATPPGA